MISRVQSYQKFPKIFRQSLLDLNVTDRIQKSVLYLRYDFFLILHRATRKTITFKMVQAGLKSVNEKYPNSNLKSAHLRLLSIGGDDCASPPCDSPGRYGRYGYPGSYTDTDTTREYVEVALPRSIRGVSNFNYRLEAVE